MCRLKFTLYDSGMSWRARRDADFERIGKTIEAIREGKDIDGDFVTLFIFGRSNVESPNQPGDIEEERVVCEPLSNTHSSTPSVSGMTPLAWIIPFIGETLWFEVMRIREVFLIHVDRPHIGNNCRAFRDEIPVEVNIFGGCVRCAS